MLSIIFDVRRVGQDRTSTLRPLIRRTSKTPLFFLFLMLMFGAASGDVSPFSEGVVTDECIGIACTTPPSELPGRL